MTTRNRRAPGGISSPTRTITCRATASGRTKLFRETFRALQTERPPEEDSETMLKVPVVIGPDARTSYPAGDLLSTACLVFTNPGGSVCARSPERIFVYASTGLCKRYLSKACGQADTPRSSDTERPRADATARGVLTTGAAGALHGDHGTGPSRE